MCIICIEYDKGILTRTDVLNIIGERIITSATVDVEFQNHVSDELVPKIINKEGTDFTEDELKVAEKWAGAINGVDEVENT